jgi:formylglycine-generating enzyme required for sulfatase activity
MKKIHGEYDDLAHYVLTANSKAAIKAIKRFMDAYPDYGDPQGLVQKFKPTSLSIMPAPFAWIEIPKKGYSIAKYPVTNVQFAKFIEAGGYRERKWWTNAGWQQREKGSWTQPRYWQDLKWNGAEQPVVGVSWYEAVAFCLWLSDAIGEKIMLPTEDQWQYAAQGDEGRTYPWGNDWDCKRCNNSVKPCDSHVTTHMRQYEGKGDSPFGVVDMAGNVWEWCLTDYDNKTNDINGNTEYRVLRGGSWGKLGPGWFRCSCRDFGGPHGWRYYVGVRVSRS